MSGSEFIFLFVGAAITLFIVAVIYSVHWKILMEKIVELKAEIYTLEETIRHLEQLVNPRDWVNASEIRIKKATKERLYDKYPDLVQPGNDIIVIKDDESIRDSS